MALSRVWTLKSMAQEALRDLGLTVGCRSYQERAAVLNRAVGSFFSTYLPMVSHAYSTPASITPASSVITDTASITAGVITGTTMSLTSANVGSMFFLDVTGTYYAGYVTGVLTALTATVSMLQAPPDGSSGTIYLFPVQTASTASLSGLPIARIGSISFGYLESTSVPLKVIRYLDYGDFLGFRAQSSGDQNTMAYSILGDTMYLAKGKNLSSFGTLTYHYTRTPIQVASDGDFIDVPDGSATELVLIKAEEIFARREGVAVPNFSAQLGVLVGALREEMDGMNVEARKVAQAQQRRDR